MKKALMTQFPFARGRDFVCKNIGDYVQTVAARQYIDEIDCYIEQEEANNFFPDDKQPRKMIMNGWFQWRAENFPPSEYVFPLLTSLHISPLRQEQLLTEKGIEFFRKFSPVGCRDLYTKKLLESKGVPAYFSACLTITLAKKYFVPKTERECVYIVDPFFEIPNLTVKNFFSTVFYYLSNMTVINKLAKQSFFADYLPTGFIDKNKKKYRKFYKAIMFYKVYSKKFSKELLLDAEYITHWLYVDMHKATNDDLIDYAENLVKKYAKAKLVVTSRIHAALPCLGLDTPVIFIANDEVLSENGTFNTPGRLGGLVDFFRILNISKSGFSTEDEVLKQFAQFDSDTDFENKKDWKLYAEKLENQCVEFMNQNDSRRGGVQPTSIFYSQKIYRKNNSVIEVKAA